MKYAMEFTEAWIDTCSSLGLLARFGNDEKLKEELEKGQSATVKDNRGWQAIHEAASNGHNNCVEILLRHAPQDCEITTYEGDTPLILTCSGGHVDCAKILIAEGANVNKSRADQHSPLLAAVKSGNIDCVKILIDAGAEVTFQYFNGWSPLHEAACQGYIDICNLLINSGATITVKDDFGITPLFTAAQYGRSECLKMLIEAAKIKDINDLVNMAADDGATPLFIASQENYKDCLDILLRNNANPNQTTVEGILPIHVATQVGNIECVDILLKHTNIDDLKKNSLSPLFLAIDWQRHDVLQHLILSGLPLSPTSIAYADNYVPIIKVPLEYGHFMTPLVYAVFTKDFTAAEMLLVAKVNPNSEKNEELPAIIPAADRGGVPFINMLIQYGLNINWKSSENLICPDILYFSLHNPDLVDFLIKSGLNIKNCFDCDCQKEIKNRISLCKVLFSCKKKYDLGIGIKKLLLFSGNVNLCSTALLYLSQQKSWNELKEVIENPRCLMHLCRLSILEHLNSAAIQKLPNSLQDYLKFFDL